MTISRELGERVDKLVESALSLASTRTKGYSLIPMQAGGTALVPWRRPSDQSLLQAFDENPWLYVKIHRVCSALASLRFEVVARRESDGESRPLPSTYPLWRLLRRPNPALRGWDFRFLTELYLRVTGALYWRLVRDGIGAPRELWLYPAHWVTQVRRRGVLQGYQVHQPVGGTINERVENMLWLRRPDPVSPYTAGVGGALSLATEVETYELASESDRRFFQNDAQPPGALVVPGAPDQEERNRIRDDWQAKVNPEGLGGQSVPILSGGLDYKQFRQGRKEMDYVEGQRWLRDVILVGVHRSIVGITEDVNLANAKVAEMNFGRWELQPSVIWWEETINEVLAPLYDTRAAVEFDNPVPSDEEFDLKKSTDGRKVGTVSKNEWREIMGFDPVPDEEDDYIYPGVFQPVPTGEQAQQFVRVPAKPSSEAGRTTEAVVAKRSEGSDPSGAGPEPQGAVGRSEREEPGLVSREGGLGAAAKNESILGDPGREAAELARRLESAYREVMVRRLDRLREEGVNPLQGTFDARMEDWIRTEGFSRVVGIDETAREKLRETLAEGVANGEGVGSLSRRVSDVYEEAKGSRADAIARTETIEASNQAALEAYKEDDAVGGAEWLTALDDVVDEDCEGLEGYVVVPGQPFPGGVEHPPLHVNCRCAVAPVVVEDMKPFEPGKYTDARLKELGLRRVWVGDAREGHKGDLRRDQEKLERAFRNRLVRAMQEQQNRVLRRLRSAT